MNAFAHIQYFIHPLVSFVKNFQFDKWDFYDASQSMEMRLAGYKVLVPWQKEPWCIHDCGYVSLKNYEIERRKFVKEYLINN